MLKWVPNPKEKLRGRKKRKAQEILSQYENIRVFYHFKERIRSLYKAKTTMKLKRYLRVY